MKLLIAIFFVIVLTVIPVPQAKGSGTAWASWYGPGLYGNTMACGGVLTKSTIGVAHKSLDCGTKLRICYLSRCFNAKVVDRGPYIYGRDFDLTGALAIKLKFHGVQRIWWQYG